ncbi:MAG: adenylosuccinate synthase [Polyangiaceae bacterium]|nr:adenylosuccinate synthase [Polyangiaceae bacterium]MBK8940440.1 adenylosuccinate synthase [Polyangiaceae bacterium]
MTAIVIVGAQWGDEGKGKIVDLASEHAEVVVRYAGGPNAGHTLVVGTEKLVVRLVPSGILQPRSMCLMGQGMVVDPGVLLTEIEALEKRGVTVRNRLFISEHAHLILPYHVLIDGLRESAATQKIGTTKKGIGPGYEDKVARRGIRFTDLRDLDRTRGLIDAALLAWAPLVHAWGASLPSTDAILDDLAPLAKKLLPMVADTGKLLDVAVRAGKHVLLEGAQGTLLDVDHGTYPFVTSSSAVAGGACTGAGIGPSRIDRVVGITKAYATRVGEGPFPSELTDEIGDQLRTRGGEFGSVTGRPRRTGWLDLPALRYAARVNGIDGWAITKLDVLTGLETVRVCVAYDTPAGRTEDFPVTELGVSRPVFEDLPGWSEAIEDIRELSQLPSNAARVVRAIEEKTGVGADIVSVGPRRDQTIVVNDLFR